MGDLFSGPHMLLILLVLLLLFGGKKIPELMRGLGKGIREFKDAKDNVSREIQEHVNTTDTRVVKSTTVNNPDGTTTTTTTVVNPPKTVSSDNSVNG
jgi:sec-independent protein translocase protein TatA